MSNQPSLHETAKNCTCGCLFLPFVIVILYGLFIGSCGGGSADNPYRNDDDTSSHYSWEH